MHLPTTLASPGTELIALAVIKNLSAGCRRAIVWFRATTWLFKASSELSTPLRSDPEEQIFIIIMTHRGCAAVDVFLFFTIVMSMMWFLLLVQGKVDYNQGSGTIKVNLVYFICRQEPISSMINLYDMILI